MREFVKEGRVIFFRPHEGLAPRHADVVGGRPVARPVAAVPDGRRVGHAGNDLFARGDGIVVVAGRRFDRMLGAESVDPGTVALVHVDDLVSPDDEGRTAGGDLCLAGMDLRCFRELALGNPGLEEKGPRNLFALPDVAVQGIDLPRRQPPGRFEPRGAQQEDVEAPVIPAGHPVAGRPDVRVPRLLPRNRTLLEKLGDALGHALVHRDLRPVAATGAVAAFLVHGLLLRQSRPVGFRPVHSAKWTGLEALTTVTCRSTRNEQILQGSSQNHEQNAHGDPVLPQHHPFSRVSKR